MLEKLKPHLISVGLKERADFMKKYLEEQAERVQDNVQHDVVLHKLLLDDRLSKEIQSNKINSNIINVVYSSIFRIDELQSLLFDGIQVKWNILNEIVKSQKFDSNVTINEFKDDYYINLDELINKKLALNENKPILIHCQDEVIESQLNEYLKNIFLQHYVDEIDFSTINYTKFRNVANDSSMFYKALIDSKGKKFIVVYKNLMIGLNSFVDALTIVYIVSVLIDNNCRKSIIIL